MYEVLQMNILNVNVFLVFKCMPENKNTDFLKNSKVNIVLENNERSKIQMDVICIRKSL